MKMEKEFEHERNDKKKNQGEWVLFVTI